MVKQNHSLFVQFMPLLSNLECSHPVCEYVGTVFGFNVRISKKIQSVAKRLGISVKQHKIIYKLLEDIKVCKLCILTPFMSALALALLLVKVLFAVTVSCR